MNAATKSTSLVVWTALACCLLLLRVPALAQPPGGDQSLYVYSGQQVLGGGVPYEAAWDQKPPAIFFVYAALWRLWPHPSVVALADLVVAGLVAGLLIVLGRRSGSATAGGLAACVFLLFAHPSLTRLSGVYVRGQCETFIALFVTAALVLASSPVRRSAMLALAGVCLGVAIWLKYNALVYALPIAAIVAPVADDRSDRGPWDVDLARIGIGVAAITAVVLLYFRAHGALTDLRLATIDYNLRYAGETYAGPIRALIYVLTLPILRAHYDMLWFLGGAGTLLALTRRPAQRAALVALVWIGAASLSIAVNGARDLPQYFVQAAPALAFAAGLGFGELSTRAPAVRILAVLVVVLGLWRVGDEAPTLGFRLGGLPQLASNVMFDVDRALGRVDDATYLSRFSQGKFDAAANDEMIRYVRSATTENDGVLVFGFSGGSIGAWSERRSPTRFFWSRPIMIGFEDGRPGYGPTGLLHDLERNPPALVVLQKLDWHVGEPTLPNSAEFFLANAALRSWLEAGYVPDRETAMFAVWRRRG
jgi:hypothetical protein